MIENGCYDRVSVIGHFFFRYNNQLTVLRNDLRFCKKKSTEQTKQLSEMQKLLAEQQKQTHEYAARLDESEKKYEEMSMKISTLLQVCICMQPIPQLLFYSKLSKNI